MRLRGGERRRRLRAVSLTPLSVASSTQLRFLIMIVMIRLLIGSCGSEGTCDAPPPDSGVSPAVLRFRLDEYRDVLTV